MTTVIGGSYPAVNSDSDATINGLTIGKGGGASATATALGNGAGQNTSGAANTSVGYFAGKDVTTGGYNFFAGFQTGGGGVNSITADNNVGIGNQAYTRGTSGTQNIAIGAVSMGANTTGSNNTAVGGFSLAANTTASNNTAVGYQAAYSNSTGAVLTAIGRFALYSNTTGTNNTAVGASSMYANTTGSSNLAMGLSSLQSNTTGVRNTALGNEAGLTLTTGNYNTFLGEQAGYLQTTSSANTFVGNGSGQSITTGGSNSILGRFSGNQGGLDIRTASNYIVLSDGDGNPRFYINNGGESVWGTYSTTGGGNGKTIQPNAGDCRMGSSVNGSTGKYHFTFYNTNGFCGSIETSGSATQYITSSDYRLKEDVTPLTGALAKITSLKPVSYKWKVDGSSGEGFIAHELQAIIPDAVTGEKDQLNEDGSIKPQGIDTSFLVATLVSAIQELKAEVDSLKQQLGK